MIGRGYISLGEIAGRLTARRVRSLRPSWPVQHRRAGREVRRRRIDRAAIERDYR
jgi:hypothetical protein